MRLRFVIPGLVIGAIAASSGVADAQTAGTSRGGAPQAEPMRWYKGNTHTHTINNGGDSTPDEVVPRYRTHA